MPIPWWLSLLPLPDGVTLLETQRYHELRSKELRLDLVTREADALAAAASKHLRVGSQGTMLKLADQLIAFDMACRLPGETVPPMTGSCRDCGGAIAAGHYICDQCQERRR